ncbi:hypothetical protein R564_26265 [Salmonella enterica subsp. enterica serovar Newport]|nr:hypothetical protein [Salmonella enterica]OSF95032.1 hypothetical protein R564_26265 [Salmonella enterica subsp. enterica serovar Newport]
MREPGNIQKVPARTPEKPRFVAGVLGPTNRTASISPDVNDKISAWPNCPALRNFEASAILILLVGSCLNYIISGSAKSRW